MAVVFCGGVAEWFKAPAWKACVRQRTVGSNPIPSSIYRFYTIQQSPKNIGQVRLLEKYSSEAIQRDLLKSTHKTSRFLSRFSLASSKNPSGN